MIQALLYPHFSDEETEAERHEEIGHRSPSMIDSRFKFRHLTSETVVVHFTTTRCYLVTSGVVSCRYGVTRNALRKLQRKGTWARNERQKLE